MKNTKMYTLFLNYRQGDDFDDHLQGAGPNVCNALRDWAESIRHHAQTCCELADLFEEAGILDESDVAVDADGHFIAFRSFDEKSEKVLEDAVEKGLLALHDFSDEDDED